MQHILTQINTDILFSESDFRYYWKFSIIFRRIIQLQKLKFSSICDRPAALKTIYIPGN
jgi:hypothetical protein